MRKSFNAFGAIAIAIMCIGNCSIEAYDDGVNVLVNEFVLNPKGCSKGPGTVSDACPVMQASSCGGTNCTPAGVGGCYSPPVGGLPAVESWFEVRPFGSGSTISNPEPALPGDPGFEVTRQEGSQIICYERRPCECRAGENGGDSQCSVMNFVDTGIIVTWLLSNERCLGAEPVPVDLPIVD